MTTQSSSEYIFDLFVMPNSICPSWKIPKIDQKNTVDKTIFPLHVFDYSNYLLALWISCTCYGVRRIHKQYVAKDKKRHMLCATYCNHALLNLHRFNWKWRKLSFVICKVFTVSGVVQNRSHFFRLLLLCVLELLKYFYICVEIDVGRAFAHFR